MAAAYDDTRLPPILTDAVWEVEFEFYGASESDPLPFAPGSKFALTLAPKGRRRPDASEVHELTTTGDEISFADNVITVSADPGPEGLDIAPCDYLVELRDVTDPDAPEALYVGEVEAVQGLSLRAAEGAGGPMPTGATVGVQVFRDPDAVRVVRGESAASVARAAASAAAAAGSAIAAANSVTDAESLIAGAAVRYDQAQSLTTGEMAQARTNIGAAATGDPETDFGGKTITQDGAARIVYSLDPTDIDADAANYNFGFNTFPGVNLPASSRKDTVFFHGYNILSNGARQNLAEPSFAYHVENFYVQGGVGVGAVEVHWNFTDTNGTITRPLGWYIPRDGSGGCLGSMAFDTMSWSDWSNDQKIKFDFLLGTVNISDSLTLSFGVNAVPAVRQNNAAGNAWINHIYVGSDDRYRGEACCSFVGNTPTTGTYANSFAVFQATSLAANGVALNVQLPAMTGNANALQLNGNTTGSTFANLTNAGSGTGAHANFVARVSGAGAGDPKILFDVNGAGSFSVGIDNSDSDKFKISSGFNLGTTDRLVIDSSGFVGLGTASPTGILDVNDDKLRVRTAKTPASATAAGNAGEVCWDANYVYVCTAANTWKRAAIASW